MAATLRRRLLWLIAARAATVTVLLGLGSALLVEVRAPGLLRIDTFFLLVGLTYGLTVFYALTLKWAESRRWLVDVQLACDAVIVTAIVHATGGIASYMPLLYALPIAAASVIQFWRGGLMVGILSSVMYSGLVLAQYLGVDVPGGVPLRPTDLPPLKVALFTCGFNVFGFLGVAALSGYLAEGKRTADARLEKASSQLADLQAFNQHVIDSLTSGLATADTSGRLLTFNRAAESITGVGAATAVGRSVFDILQLPPELESALGHGLEPGRSRRVDFGFTRAGGRHIELGISVAPLITPSGQEGYLFTFQDVTDARRLEREVRIQQRLAAVGEMAAGIAHEIRNPLASMSGSIQILRQDLPLSDEQAQLMDIVLRESERLNDTIRSFLAYARPHRLPASRLDLRRAISDTALLLRNSTECRDTHEIEIGTPDTEVWYEADEGQMRQIVWNLATNGLRAMPAGGRLRLTVGTEEASGGGVVLSVQDEGVGIPPEELDRIFQPFRGGFSRGTGLGLSIVHRIVSDYGGEVQVTSEREIGTTVRVRLPIRRVQPAVALGEVN
jgi:two-component system sensor histidine kinase PilS (NtrC family)